MLGRYETEGHPPGAIGWTVAFSYNLHLCGLTCEGYPGYQAWLLKDVPKIGDTLGFHEDGEVYPVTWGGLILGVLALLLVFLALTGIWLWWPTIRHFKRGVRIRFGKNRYARDYDLHQVVGMIALPLLLMWGLTGMSYEFGFVEKGWYKALPGEHEHEELVVDDTATTEITYDEALAAAQEAAGTDRRPHLLLHADRRRPGRLLGLLVLRRLRPVGRVDVRRRPRGPGRPTRRVERRRDLRRRGQPDRADDLPGLQLPGALRLLRQRLVADHLVRPRPGPAAADVDRHLHLAVQAGGPQAPPSRRQGRHRLMAALTLVAVVYLGVVAVLALLTGLGAPLHAAMRTGFAVGRVGAGLVAVLDVGHAAARPPAGRPRHPRGVRRLRGRAAVAAHQPRGAPERGGPSPWVVAAASAATAVVLVRLAQTWA